MKSNKHAIENVAPPIERVVEKLHVPAIDPSLWIVPENVASPASESHFAENAHPASIPEQPASGDPNPVTPASVTTEVWSAGVYCWQSGPPEA
ncbi:MAG: hypothetical protein WBY94_16375 [Polyangiaceae bacterium]